jgi:F420-non-reducing hydrogenase small subunit
VTKKKTIAIYSATGCRACENAILDIHYQISSLTRWADICFWPYVLGSEWDDLDSRKEVDVCIFTGAIVTEDDRAAAVRLRERSRLMIACGACAAFGGIQGLLALSNREENSSGPNNPELPRLEQRVSALSQVVDVDYVVPNCPPHQNYLWSALQCLIFSGSAPVRLSFSYCRLPEDIAQAAASGVLPPKGSVFAGERAVCASCSRVKEKKEFKEYSRPGRKETDPNRCLLEQGYLCMGIVTREGCGGLCTAVGLPCRGCSGKTANILDPGAKMVSAVSSTFNSADPEIIENLVDGFVDLKGTFYRYTMASQCTLLSAKSNR